MRESELPAGVEVRALDPSDEPGLQEVFDGSADYFEAATGGPPGSAELQSLYYALPDGVDFDAKRMLVVLRGGRYVGVIDAVAHYPTRGECAVGLFLLHADHRRRGLGTYVARFLLDMARREGIHSVNVTTPTGWRPGAAFLDRLGFTLTTRGDSCVASLSW